jgi:hypothetical protein
MSNSDFAIYINSASSQIQTNEKSRVSIPFLSNIAKHDASKSAQLSLLSFRFVNSVYNIKEGYNKLKVLTRYAAGRGLPESEEYILLEVPFGNYDADKLATYFSTVSNLGFEVIQQLFEYNAKSSNNNIFVGFGAYPLGETDPTITPALAYDNTQTKLYFQSPDLKHMIQYETNTMTPCINIDKTNPNVDPTTVLDHSYIYAGIYLIVDSETEGLMNLLGFETSSRFEVPVVSIYGGQVRKGYGVPFLYRNMYANSKEPYTDPASIQNFDMALSRVEYGYYDGVLKKYVWPTIESTITFQGILYEDGVVLTVPTTTADLPSVSNPNGEINFLPVSSIISGTNIVNETPIVVNIQQVYFYASVVFEDGHYRLQWDDNYNGAIGSNNIAPLVGMALTNAGGFVPNSQQQGGGGIWPSDTPVTGLIGIYCTGRGGEDAEKRQIYLSNDTAPLFYYDIGADGLPTGTETPYETDGTKYPFYGFSYTLSLPQEENQTLTTMTSAAGTLTNPSANLFPQNVTNLSGLDEIYLKCAQLHTLSYASLNRQPLAPSDTIAVIPVDVAYAEKQTYMPQFPVSCNLNNTNITQLDFVLTNSKNELLDFNGVDWSAVMAVTMQDIPQVEDPGTVNTPFQAQLNVLEGTTFAETRKKRQMIFHSQSSF